MRKTCILKWCNLKLSSVQNCLLVFVLVVCTFIYTLKLCHMLRLTAKALPLIKSTSTVQGCSSELLYSLGASTSGLTDHSCWCFNPNSLSVTWECKFWMFLCFSALKWMAGSVTWGYWKFIWNLCPKLLLVFWCELGTFTTCLFILICRWSREISQLLTNTSAISLKVWKDDSSFLQLEVFFHLSRKRLSQCKYLWIKCTSHFLC